MGYMTSLPGTEQGYSMIIKRSGMGMGKEPANASSVQ